MSDKNYHNQGQSDAAEGKYDPPYKDGEAIFDLINPLASQEAISEKCENNKEYKAGHEHGESQKR